MSSRNWRRALVVAALCGGLGLVSGPGVSARADYVFNDSHFHLTNYIQEGITVQDFLKIMGDKVGRSTLFGIPLQQTVGVREHRRLRARRTTCRPTRRSTTTPSPTPTSRCSTDRSRRSSRRGSTR